MKYSYCCQPFLGPPTDPESHVVLVHVHSLELGGPGFRSGPCYIQAVAFEADSITAPLPRECQRGKTEVADF